MRHFKLHDSCEERPLNIIKNKLKKKCSFILGKVVSWTILKYKMKTLWGIANTLALGELYLTPNISVKMLYSEAAMVSFTPRSHIKLFYKRMNSSSFAPPSLSASPPLPPSSSYPHPISLSPEVPKPPPSEWTASIQDEFNCHLILLTILGGPLNWACQSQETWKKKTHFLLPTYCWGRLSHIYRWTEI